MEMQKRTLLAVVISVVILLIFQNFNSKKVIPNNNNDVLSVNGKEHAVDNKETEGLESIDLAKKLEKDVTKNREQEEKKSITNGSITIEVSSLQAGISSMKIKDKKEGQVELVRKNEMPYSLGMEVTGRKKWHLIKNGENNLVAKINYKGINIERKYNISDENIVLIENKIKNTRKEKMEIEVKQSWFNGLGTTKDIEKENYIDNRPVAKINGRPRSKLENGDFSGQIEWAGIVNRYFLAVFIEIDEIFNELKIDGGKRGGRGCAAGTGGKFPEIVLKGKLSLASEETIRFNQKLYGGLKEYSKIKKIGKNLDKILSFGIFGFLSRIFLNILIWFKSFTGNYGIAIILLTMVLQVFIFPLTVKSFKSMKAMKEIQPKMTDLKGKYKDDPQRMNQEMLALYKRHKVNPFSGCLPLIMQMPIFISLFTMLRGATELRYAGFLWIHDLSKADILFSSIPLVKNIPVIGSGGPLPFLMGGAMFLQQKFTGGGMEGPQKSLTYMMPIMFTFLFMKFPSGLVLYWLSNSILTFIIQYNINKIKK